MYASYCLSTHRRLSLHAVFLTAFVAPMIVPAQLLEEIVVTAQKREESIQESIGRINTLFPKATL